MITHLQRITALDSMSLSIDNNTKAINTISTQYRLIESNLRIPLQLAPSLISSSSSLSPRTNRTDQNTSDQTNTTQSSQHEPSPTHQSHTSHCPPLDIKHPPPNHQTPNLPLLQVHNKLTHSLVSLSPPHTHSFPKHTPLLTQPSSFPSNPKTFQPINNGQLHFHRFRDSCPLFQHQPRQWLPPGWLRPSKEWWFPPHLHMHPSEEWWFPPHFYMHPSKGYYWWCPPHLHMLSPAQLNMLSSSLLLESE